MALSLPVSFLVGERVIIDNCDSLVGTITAICYRSSNYITYEVSWVNDSCRSGWVEGWRLKKWEE